MSAALQIGGGGLSGRVLSASAGPRRELSLCEFLAHGGGLVDHGGDLRAMDAHHWHRAAPFRARLVNNERGVSLDTAARQAWDAGYFGDGGDRPDVNALLELIAEELSGRTIWAEHGAKYMESVLDHCASRAAFYGEEEEVAEPFVNASYERPYVTKKGRHGVTYYGKVTRGGKSVFHKTFHDDAAARDAAVAAFIAAEG